MAASQVIDNTPVMGLANMTVNGKSGPVASAGVSDESFNMPDWLTKEYLEHCLRKHYNDSNLRVHEMLAVPALGKGENYGGVLTRITARYVTGAGHMETGRYIVKTTFEGDEFIRQLTEPYDLFNCEMTIYEEVLPKLKALLAEIGDEEHIFAKALGVDYERQGLIFEDLRASGYVMPDRLKGLDANLTKMVLRKLAKMHATSAVLNEREQGVLQSYDRGMFNRYTENNSPCFLGLLEACSRQVSQWKDYKSYGKKLADLKTVHMELAKRVFDPIPGQLNVLTHGDFWTNNIMVKYDKRTGAPVDAVIIDFQYSTWGSPAIDLFYFLNTSLEEDLHLHAHNELICYYYTVLADTLQRLGYKARIPSLYNFHLQLESKAFYAFHSTCVVQPVHRVEETEDADFNALIKQDERGIRFKDTCFRNPYCKRIIRHLLPMYEHKGFLEIDQD